MKSPRKAAAAIVAIVAVALYRGGGLGGETFQNYLGWSGWSNDVIGDCLGCRPPIWSELLDGLLTAAAFLIVASVVARFMPGEQAHGPASQH